MGSVSDFDLLAASLRADATDLRVFVEALATKLEGALPERVSVDRGGVFGRKRVRRVDVQLGGERYELEHDDGQVECRRSEVVRGITLKTEPLELDAWIERLSRRLLEEAARSERDRAALDRILER